MDPFTQIDGRTQRGRAFKELVGQIENAVGHDLTTMQKMHVQNVAALNLIIAEKRECLVEGEKINADEFNRLLNTLARLERGLGLRPDNGKSKDDESGVIDDLDDYLHGKYGQALDKIDVPRVNGRRRLRSDLVRKR